MASRGMLALACVMLASCVAPNADAKRRTPSHQADGEPSTNVDAAARFASFTAGAASARISSDAAIRAYVTEGVTHLSDTIDEIVAANAAAPSEARDRAAELRNAADDMRRDPSDATRVSIVRGAFITAAGAITVLQRDRYPHLDRAAFQVRLAARRVSARESVMLQQPALRRFFERASDALLAMHP